MISIYFALMLWFGPRDDYFVNKAIGVYILDTRYYRALMINNSREYIDIEIVEPFEGQTITIDFPNGRKTYIVRDNQLIEVNK